jgi:hypothetical protein
MSSSQQHILACDSGGDPTIFNVVRDVSVRKECGNRFLEQNLCVYYAIAVMCYKFYIDISNI